MQGIAGPFDADHGLTGGAPAIDGDRAQDAGAQDHRGQRALDPLAVGDQRKRGLDVRVDVRVRSQAPQRSARGLDQLDRFAGLLVQHEPRSLDARDLEHLFQERVEPFRLPLQHLHAAGITCLALLQAARKRIGEPLDAGERRLQLVRGEREEPVLAGFAFRGREDRGRPREQRP